MVSILDQQVGEIIDKVNELGIAENTIIIFSSDNGPHLEEEQILTTLIAMENLKDIKGIYMKEVLGFQLLYTGQKQLMEGSIADIYLRFGIFSNCHGNCRH